jgi:hypothetical protein
MVGAGDRHGPRSRTSHNADAVHYHHRHHRQQQQQQQKEQEQQQPCNAQYNYIRIFECMSCTSAAAALNSSSSNDNNNDEISFGILLLSDEASRLFQDAIAGNMMARLRV